MSQLKPLASKGKGSIGVILPDTVTSARYTEFDAPYLAKALSTAGLSSSQYSVLNAQGSDSTQFTDAQEDITKGAEEMGVPLDEHITFCIAAMREIADRLGLMPAGGPPRDSANE